LAAIERPYPPFTAPFVAVLRRQMAANGGKWHLRRLPGAGVDVGLEKYWFGLSPVCLGLQRAAAVWRQGGV